MTSALLVLTMLTQTSISGTFNFKWLVVECFLNPQGLFKMFCKHDHSRKAEKINFFITP
ncbi:hypothetical protein EXN66_Car005002 [Channa argus]|uniref:Uncharacterized protein n=1 Tax=Channa argus TaxID=215402 RepID=A0A6G1PGA0_CHAAH|nr:hypothetical protein EXN66_Car005002 [Channa argus]